jgi:hypothetical protein
VHPLKKEFIELYRTSGWTQAEAARQLELTRGGVNGIITGPTVPSLATVKLFRLILESPPGVLRKTGQTGREVEDWAEPLLSELRRFDDTTRERLVAALRDILRATSDKGGRTKRAG